MWASARRTLSSYEVRPVSAFQRAHPIDVASGAGGPAAIRASSQSARASARRLPRSEEELRASGRTDKKALGRVYLIYRPGGVVGGPPPHPVLVRGPAGFRVPARASDRRGQRGGRAGRDPRLQPVRARFRPPPP